MKCLIIGASGQVGGQLVRRCSADGLAYLGTTRMRSHSVYRTLDLCDTTAVRDLLDTERPDIVFLPAAMTHVDRAELHPAECRAVNVDAVEIVARTVREIGGRLVVFSTDHVFAECDRPMGEDDPVHPLNVYAKTKCEGEQRVREQLPDSHLILRTSWVFGPDEQGKNFVYRAVQTLRAGRSLVAAADQYGQPTYGPDLARVAVELALSHQVGTFHVVGPTRLTRLDYSQMIARIFQLDPAPIVGRLTHEMQQSAPRPLSVWLSDEKLRRLGVVPIAAPEVALRLMRDTIPSDASPV